MENTEPIIVKPLKEVPLSHTPGTDHRGKSDPSKQKRWQKKAKEKKEEAWKRYDESKKEWNEMSELERRWRGIIDPERIKPKGERPINMNEEINMNEKLKVLIKLEYFCIKLRRWLYQDRGYAKRRYLNRLEQALNDLPGSNEAIIKQESLALLYELKGETALAIRHRKQEIKLIEKLHKAAEKHKPSTRAYMLNGLNEHQRLGTKELQGRRAILQHLKTGHTASGS